MTAVDQAWAELRDATDGERRHALAMLTATAPEMLLAALAAARAADARGVEVTR